MSKQIQWWDQINLHQPQDLLGVVFPHYIFLQINTWLWRHFWSATGLQSAGLRFAATEKATVLEKSLRVINEVICLFYFSVVQPQGQWLDSIIGWRKGNYTLTMFCKHVLDLSYTDQHLIRKILQKISFIVLLIKTYQTGKLSWFISTLGSVFDDLNRGVLIFVMTVNIDSVYFQCIYICNRVTGLVFYQFFSTPQFFDHGIVGLMWN